MTRHFLFFCSLGMTLLVKKTALPNIETPAEAPNVGRRIVPHQVNLFGQVWATRHIEVGCVAQPHSRGPATKAISE